MNGLCELGEIVIPDWMLALAELDDCPMTLRMLAAKFTGRPMLEPKESKRNAAIRKAYASGEWSQRELARKWGLARTSIEKIVEGVPRTHHKRGKP